VEACATPRCSYPSCIHPSGSGSAPPVESKPRSETAGVAPLRGGGGGPSLRGLRACAEVALRVVMTPVDHGTARLSSRAVGGSVGNAHMVRKGSDPSQWDGSHTVLQMGHRQSRWACAGGGAVGAEEDDEEEGHEISHGETTSRQVSFNLCNAILGAHRPAWLSRPKL
jgi:hypothetical protein